MLYHIPLGLTYLGNKGFRVSFDLGPQFYKGGEPYDILGVNLRLGISF